MAKRSITPVELSSGASSDHRAHLSRRCKLAGLVLAITFIQAILPSPANCQDFEDLNKPTTSNGNLQLPQFTFQQINRQQPQQAPAPQQPVAVSSNSNNNNGLPAQPTTAAVAPQPARQTTATRPLLSSRFGPQASGPNSISAQASQSATTFASPQPAAPAATSQTSSPQQVAGVDQIMKNALARSARLEANADERQDNGPPESRVLQSRSGQQQAANNGADKLAESSEATSDTQLAPEGDDKATTLGQTATTSGHETVYSDQRFANLFARRGAGKKARIAPTEQVKAKPTLPSFIKSPPDPKQFAATASFEQQSNNGGGRSVTPAASATNFASARLQQQNPLDRSRVNLANQQKKSAAISASAAAAAQNIANKRNNGNNNSLNNNKPSPPLPKASNKATAASATTSKPPVSANNPFNRAQSNSNDPANVIAMARKRLLANNALESGKLKLQQQQQQQKIATASTTK